MARSSKDEPEIVRAAAALEEEIAGLEALSRSARKIKLTSEKNIARAAAELKQVAALPDRLGERLQAVAAAMAQMQERQQAALAPLATLAAEIQERAAKLDAHVRAFGALGQSAADVNTELSAAPDDQGARARAEARLREISDGARALFEAARDDDFPEIAREADVLKQRMAALGQRLGHSAR